MVSQLKRTARPSRPWKSYWRGRRKTRSIARLALETLEDRLAPAGTVHFAVIGDYGLAGPNEQAVANLVKSWNPDFIVTAGDNNYPSGETATIDQNVGQYYSSYISPYKGTYGSGAASNMFWPTLGNHDWYNTGANAAPYLSYFTLPGNGRYYKLSEGPVDFFMIDSNFYEPDGNGASSVQASWLQSQLAQSTAQWKIVDFHDAPYSSGPAGSNTTMQWPFQQWGATAVISGQNHDYERFNINGIPYFVDGTGGVGLDNFVSNFLPNEVARDSGHYGAMLITASASKISYQFTTTDGTVIDAFSVNYPLPAAPSNLSAAAQPSGKQVNVTWTDNANNESGYSVERSTNGGNFSVIATLGIHASHYLDSSVSSGTSYSYRVSAFNAGGSSAYSNTASVSTPTPLLNHPLTPSNPAATTASANQINLNWTDNSLGLDHFSIERSADGSNFAPVGTAPAGATSYSDSGLASGNYFYRIRGVDALGVTYTDYTAVIMGTLAPKAPSGLTATAGSSQQINLNWTDNSNNESGFTISQSADGTNFTQIGSVASGVVTYQVNGLNWSTTYYFKVAAFNSAGSASSSTASATTKLAPPADASNLTVTAAGSNQITLSWTDNSKAPEEDGFNIYMSSDGINFTWAYVASQDVTNFSATGLNPDTIYYFYVKAYNAADVSGPTNMGRARTFPPILVPPQTSDHFAVIGDFGNTGPSEQAVANLVHSWNPDFIATVGDNNYDTGSASTIDANIGQYYHDYIYPYLGSYGSGSPTATNRFWPTLGNHDWGDTFPNPTGDQPYLNYFTSLPGNGRYYDFVVGPVHFFMLDSDVNEPDGNMWTSIQAQWLKNALAASTSSWNLVLLHHSPFSAGSEGSQTDSQWPFQAWGASAVLAGHNHVYERIMVNGFPYIVDGIGGAGLGPFVTAPISGTVAADNSDYGAMLVDANSSQITFKEISTSGAVIDSYTLTNPAPATPSSLAGMPVSAGQINLTWTSNSANASGYYVYRSTDGIKFNQIATVGPYTTNYLDQGLAPGDYYYQVMAFNSGGFSPVSSASHTTLPVPQPRMPDQPTNLTAVPVANNRIVVSWQDNSGGQDTFNIFRSTDGSTFTQVATAAKGAITFTDSLATSTTYFYQITATNSKGNTPATPVVSATLAPPAPTSLTATAASSVQVNLAWTADSSNVTSFAILQSTDGVNFTQRTTVIPSTRSFSVTYLSPNTTYYFKVSATNGTGSTASQVATVTTPVLLPPAAPSGLTTTPILATRSDLTWTNNSTTQEQDSIAVYLCTDNINFFWKYTLPGIANYFPVGKLSPSTTYYFKLRAFNAAGSSDYTPVVSVTTLGVPNAPSNLTATAANANQINLSWTNNDATATGTKIYKSSDGFTFKWSFTMAQGVSSYSVTGLAPTSTYSFYVVAFNANGQSDPSSTVSATTPALPLAPSGLTANAVSPIEIDLSWTTNDTTATSTAIYKSTDGVNFTWSYTVAAGLSAYAVKDLTQTTTYYFKVATISPAGKSPFSNTVSATTLTPPPPPAAPSGLAASTISASEIDLSWTNNDSTATGTKIYKSTDDVSFTWSYTMAAGVSSYAVKDLTQTTTYYFYVAAFNANGTSAHSNTVSATTMTLPAAPSNLTATAASTSEIDLAWTNNDTSATQTAIYKSTDGVNFTWSYTASAGIASYSVTGLAASTTYTFELAAISPAGKSAFSNTASATTQAAPQPPPAPTNLTAAAVSATQINLAWTNNDATATGTKIYLSTDGVNFTWAYTMAQGVSSYSAINLSPSTTYSFKVVAYNSVGNSAFSNTVSATTMPLVAAPSNLTATTVNATQINLAWTNNDTSASGTKIYKSTDGVNFTWSYTMAQGVSSYSVQNLSPSTTYYFKVAAYNSAGTSAFSNTVNATTMAVPANPTNLTATGTSASQINLAWANNAVNPAATNIAVYKSTDGVNFSWSYTLSPTASSFSVTGLTASTTYYFRIRAYNANGTSGYSNTSSATTSPTTAPTTAPAAPSGLTATAATSSQINLTWTNNAINQNGFQIQQSSDGTTFTTVASVGAGITSYLVSGLSASTTYYFQVIAYNPVGSSAPSNVASATTAAGGADVSGAFASHQVIVAGLGQTLGWSTTLGAPITLGVYVDNSDGSMTPDEQARIADAIAALNVTWNGTTGLQLVLVSDPSQALIIVHNLVTSPLGGLADGILGDAELSYVYSPDGRLDNGSPYQVFAGQMQVDIIEGWNWYTQPIQANTGMTAITNNQYDYESVVVHELGHAVGLYHDTSVYGMLNGDGLSPMNPLLYVGQVHRQLSPYDVSWLKHLYAYGPNPGNNQVPVPHDAVRAFFTSGDDDALRPLRESGPAEAFSGSSAASASADLFILSSSSSATSPRAPVGIFFQLGADPAAPPAVQMAVLPSIGLAGTPSLATPSEADAVGGPMAVGATPATVMSPSASSPSSSGMTDPMQPLEDGNGAPDRGSGAASEGPAKAPVDSGATLRSGASIWDIPTLDDMTGSRLNGYRKETDSLSEVAPSIWEEPGVSEGLCLSDPAVFALSPAVAAAVLALLSDRPTKARAEDTARFSGGIQRKNQPCAW